MLRWSVLLGLLAAAAPVSADVAEQARFHDELAREHFERARRTGQTRYVDLALREFFLEQRLAPNPRIVFNIALCFSLLRRDAQAFHYYDEYLSSDDDDPERRRTSTEAVRALRARLALVRISTAPGRASIFVDREELGAWGQSPRLVALSPGGHRILLRADGYHPAERTVEAVVGEERELDVELRRIVGTLVVQTDLPGRVRVRDASGRIVAEASAPLRASIPPGAYEVELDAEGYRRWSGLARVEADAERVLTPRPDALPPPSGRLSVVSDVVGATVFIDGEPTGFTPMVLPAARTGEHRVRVQAADRTPWEGTATVEESQTGWLTVELAPREQVRSEATWWMLGLGGASLLAGGVVGVYALQRQAELGAGQPVPALLADALLLQGGVHVGIALVLFFATVRSVPGDSSAVFSASVEP